VWTKAHTGCGYSTSTLNSSLSLTFDGTYGIAASFCCHWSHRFYAGVSIHVLGDLSLYGGIVEIALDSQPARLIDLYGTSNCGQVLFSGIGLVDGEHSISLKLIGESPNRTSTNRGPTRLFVFKNFM
jgi:hypothetical protein